MATSVLDLATAHDLAVCSTFTAKREAQKITYSSGERQTELDYVLVRRSSLRTVRDIKVPSGEELAPQHRPVLADIAIHLPKKTKVRTERRIRWWKLHNENKGDLKRRVMENGLPDPEVPVQRTWGNAAETILRCAKEVLGETRGGFRGDKAAWFWNEEVQQVVKQKKNASSAGRRPEALSTLLPIGVASRQPSPRLRTRKWMPSVTSLGPSL